MRAGLWIAGAAIALALTGGGAARADSTIVGDWLLVEQTYGSGRANQIDRGAAPLRLRFERRGGEIVGSIGVGSGPAAERAWPRLVDDASRAVTIDERRVGRDEGRIEVHYRVAPSPGDDLTLHVTERYRVLDDGRTLEGEVVVAFRRAGEARGSYTLTRRFERRP